MGCGESRRVGERFPDAARGSSKRGKISGGGLQNAEGLQFRVTLAIDHFQMTPSGLSD